LTSIVYVDNDNRLLVESVHTYDDMGAQVYLDETGMVSVTLTDTDGEEIAGETWPLSLAYLPDSQGDFYGILRNELALTEGQTVYAELLVDNGIDQFGSLRGTLLVQRRTF